MKTKTRIYVATGPDGVPHLIEATNPAVARNHLVRGSVMVEVADQLDLVELIGKGLKVEKAGGEDE